MPGTTVCHYADCKKKTCTDQRLKTLEECGYLGGAQEGCGGREWGRITFTFH